MKSLTAMFLFLIFFTPQLLLANDELKEACDGGDNDACINLKIINKTEEVIPQDYTKTVKLFTKACDDGLMLSCNYLAHIYHDGIGVKQDYIKAKKIYTKACNGDLMRSCFYLGAMHHYGEGIKQDYKKARKYYNEACSGGYNNACNALGVLYKKGEGVKQDDSKAIKYYAKACEGNVLKSCFSLAEMYKNGTGVAINHKKAIELFDKSIMISKDNCDKADSDSDRTRECKTYNLYQNIVAFHKTEIECNQGSLDSCVTTGIDYADGKSSNQDYDKALGAFNKACEGGNNQGCTNFKNIYNSVCLTNPKKYCSKYE